MADVIHAKDIDRLVSCAKKLANEEEHSAIQVIKKVISAENCSLAEAKEAYLLAVNNETLGEYQGRVILPFIEELEALEREK